MICGLGGASGTYGEPIACGYEQGHAGNHSWASLPTFIDGHTLLERAALRFVAAGQAEAARVVRTKRAMDPASPEWQERIVALAALVEVATGTDRTDK